MTPLAQRLLNAYDSRDRDQLQNAVEEVNKLVLRQHLPPPGPVQCNCGAANIGAPASHVWSCPLRVWGSPK